MLLLYCEIVLKVNKLNGMKVITADAHTLGEVNGAHFNTANWAITNLDVHLTKESSKELGLKKLKFMSMTVCLPVSVVKDIGDVITLKQTLEEFKDLKECKIN